MYTGENDAVVVIREWTLPVALCSAETCYDKQFMSLYYFITLIINMLLIILSRYY
jgi:hypothetical protein